MTNQSQQTSTSSFLAPLFTHFSDLGSSRQLHPTKQKTNKPTEKMKTSEKTENTENTDKSEKTETENPTKLLLLSLTSPLLFSSLSPNWYYAGLHHQQLHVQTVPASERDPYLQAQAADIHRHIWRARELSRNRGMCKVLIFLIFHPTNSRSKIPRHTTGKSCSRTTRLSAGPTSRRSRSAWAKCAAGTAISWRSARCWSRKRQKWSFRLFRARFSSAWTSSTTWTSRADARGSSGFWRWSAGILCSRRAWPHWWTLSRTTSGSRSNSTTESGVSAWMRVCCGLWVMGESGGLYMEGIVLKKCREEMKLEMRIEVGNREKWKLERSGNWKLKLELKLEVGIGVENRKTGNCVWWSSMAQWFIGKVGEGKGKWVRNWRLSDYIFHWLLPLSSQSNALKAIL